MTMAVTRRLFWLLGAVALASTGMPAVAQDAAGQTAPVVALDDGLIAVMKAGTATPFEQRMQMFIAVVQRAFDLPGVVQATVGLRFANFSPEQQQQLIQAFTRFTAASYVANFDSFNGQRFEISPAVRRVGNDHVVSTQFIDSGGTTRFDYVVRDTGAGYKIVDVLLDGSISRVAVQRSDFRSALSNNDPSGLIAMLQNKTATLAAGSKG